MQRQFSLSISIPFQIILCILIGTLVGVSTLWLSPVFAVMEIAGVLYLVISWAWPEIAILAILLLTSTIFDINQIPSISIGFGHFVATDFLIFIPIGIILLRSRVEPGFVLYSSPLDIWLLLFYSVAIFSTVLAILRGSLTFNQSLGEIRVITSYLIFFLVTNLIRNEKSLRRLLSGFFILAVFVGVVMVAQYVLGGTLKILPGRVETLGTAGVVDTGVTRILPPGQSIVLVVFVCLAVLLIFDRTPSKFLLRFVSAGITGLAVLLTFNRNFWVAILLAIIFVFYLISEREKMRSARIAFWGLMVAIFLLTPVIATVGAQATDLINGSVQRFTTVFNPSTVQEDSLRYRYVENNYAIPQIVAHPILGLGLGAAYRTCDRQIDSGCNLEWNFLTYIHNGHLWLLLKTGVIGYILFMVMMVIYIRRGLQYWRQIPDVYFRAILLAFAVMTVGIIVAATVNPVFSTFFWTPVIAIMMGATEVILRLNKDRLVKLPALEAQN